MSAQFLDKHFGRLGNRMFQSAYIYAQFKDGTIPDIYLQNNKYFEKYAHHIRRIFGEGINQNNLVAIHVRRGDYIDNPFYVDLSETDYYQKAMAMFPHKEFLMFSDDINWCIGEWEWNKKIKFSVGRTEEEDLKLMAGCEGVIMANSSFSWWGAFLGDKRKKVIYPKAWFRDGIQRVGFPGNWQGI